MNKKSVYVYSSYHEADRDIGFRDPNGQVLIIDNGEACPKDNESCIYFDHR